MAHLLGTFGQGFGSISVEAEEKLPDALQFFASYSTGKDGATASVRVSLRRGQVAALTDVLQSWLEVEPDE